MSAQVVKFRPEGNAADIVASLRRLADEFESGREPCPPTLVAVADDGDALCMWVWGRETTHQHLAGLLLAAAIRPVMP